ncbi:MAG: hypothetical protein K9J30_05790 [Bacteroidales bacterium]|nr:hypothetical protein [Bacteroidales bacterium]
MKNMVTFLVIGLIIGIILTSVIIFLSATSMMFKENKSNYDFETTLGELEKSVENAGWKIPHVKTVSGPILY